MTLAYLTPHDAKKLANGERSKLQPLLVSRIGSIIRPADSADYHSRTAPTDRTTRTDRINAMLQEAVNNQLASSQK